MSRGLGLWQAPALSFFRLLLVGGAARLVLILLDEFLGALPVAAGVELCASSVLGALTSQAFLICAACSSLTGVLQASAVCRKVPHFRQVLAPSTQAKRSTVTHASPLIPTEMVE